MYAPQIKGITVLQCAAAAKSLQSCLTLCDPIDGSPPGSSVHKILQARILAWVAMAFLYIWLWCSRKHCVILKHTGLRM